MIATVVVTKTFGFDVEIPDGVSDEQAEYYVYDYVETHQQELDNAASYPGWEAAEVYFE